MLLNYISDMRITLRIDRNNSVMAVGRVILSSNNFRGSLCSYDNVWGNDEARTTCRMLGFT